MASLAGLALALGVPLAAATVTGSGGSPPDANGSVTAVLINEIFMWGLTCAVLGVVVFWERRPLASIGLVRPSWNAIQIGAGLAIALLILAMVAGVIAQLFGAHADPDGQDRMVLGLPFWVQLLAAISAGFTEEILFRGYAVERTTELTGRRWLGAAFPVIAFGAVHAPFWGIAHALVAGMTGLWLTLAYLWRRNLWTNIAAHALLDTLVFIAIDQAPLQGPVHV
jgi:membrane protease YdiL (CAAX protease family)